MAAHTNVCVIGLGSMGMGAARACLQAGLNTWGVDINPDNCRALLAAGAKGAGPSAVPFAAELDAVVLKNRIFFIILPICRRYTWHLKNIMKNMTGF